MFNKLPFVVCSFAMMTLSACVPIGQLDTFSNYMVDNNINHKIYVFTDCLVTSDLDGDEKFNEISVNYNVELCKKLSANVLEELRYKTDAQLVESSVTVGLQAGYRRYAKGINGDVMLPVHVGDTRFQNRYLKRLSEISEALSVYAYGYQERQEYVQSLVGKSYKGIIDDSGSHEVLLIQINGVNSITANDEVDVGEVLLTGLLALGGTFRMTFYPTSTRAIMLNSRGEVIWGDVEFKTQSPLPDCEAKSLSRNLLKYLNSRKEIKELPKREPINCNYHDEAGSFRS